LIFFAKKKYNRVLTATSIFVKFKVTFNLMPSRNLSADWKVYN